MIATAATLAGCSDDELVPESENNSGDTPVNPGVVSAKNFSIAFNPVNPPVFDLSTNIWTATDMTVTAFVGDRNNVVITDPHTVFFETEWGLIDTNCTTDENGSCEVTWRARKSPAAEVPDGLVTIIAYTSGEEAFVDTNGNSNYDDGETFTDLEEPYLDNNFNGSFDGGDKIIDVVSAEDPTGVNLNHDDADGFFNGPGCTHTTECGQTSVTIYRQSQVNIFTNGFSVGGDVNGLNAGQSVSIQITTNTGSSVVVLSTDTSYTFTDLANNTFFTLSIIATSGGTACTFDSNASVTYSDTVNGADDSDNDISCA